MPESDFFDDVLQEEFDSEYLLFFRLPKMPARKTYVWDVQSKSGSTLGQIAWFAPWRCFTFQPTPNTIFNVGCMNDLCTFIARVTIERKEERGG